MAKSADPAELFFWRSRSQSEVDLIIRTGDELQPFGIKWSRSRRRAGAFENAYHVPVETLTSLQPSEWPLSLFPDAM